MLVKIAVVILCKISMKAGIMVKVIKKHRIYLANYHIAKKSLLV
jgi:hypothetical protein